MKTVDINCDMGESFGRFIIGNDQEVMPYITSCNIACGFHGGDPLTIEKTIKSALEHNVKIGAHPSYPDLAGFGRREMTIHHDELKAILKYQISAIKGMTEALGGKLHHIKPHGALYNTACNEEMVAAIICKCIKDIDPELSLYGSGKSWQQITHAENIRFVYEVFADRNYKDNLTLVPRNEAGAMILSVDESIDHVINMVRDRRVKTLSGKMKSIHPETVCIHGDQANAAQLARALKNVLKKIDVTISSPVK